MSISYVESMCCLFWKTLWDFYMVLHSKEDWTTYFRTINIPDDASTTYAAIFHKNHDWWNSCWTTADKLRQPGIRIFGDIKTILHHAKVNTPATTIPPDNTTSPTTINTFIKTPAAKPPIILHDMTRPQFCKFQTEIFLKGLPTYQTTRYMHNSTMHVMKLFKTTLLIPLLISSL